MQRHERQEQPLRVINVLEVKEGTLCLRIRRFDAQTGQLSSSHGVFASEGGMCISSYREHELLQLVLSSAHTLDAATAASNTFKTQGTVLVAGGMREAVSLNDYLRSPEVRARTLFELKKGADGTALLGVVAEAPFASPVICYQGICWDESHCTASELQDYAVTGFERFEQQQGCLRATPACLRDLYSPDGAPTAQLLELLQAGVAWISACPALPPLKAGTLLQKLRLPAAAAAVAAPAAAAAAGLPQALPAAALQLEAPPAQDSPVPGGPQNNPRSRRRKQQQAGREAKRQRLQQQPQQQLLPQGLPAASGNAAGAAAAAAAAAAAPKHVMRTRGVAAKEKKAAAGQQLGAVGALVNILFEDLAAEEEAEAAPADKQHRAAKEGAAAAAKVPARLATLGAAAAAQQKQAAGMGMAAAPQQQLAAPRGLGLGAGAAAGMLDSGALLARAAAAAAGNMQRRAAVQGIADEPLMLPAPEAAAMEGQQQAVRGGAAAAVEAAAQQQAAQQALLYARVVQPLMQRALRAANTPGEGAVAAAREKVKQWAQEFNQPAAAVAAPVAAAPANGQAARRAVVAGPAGRAAAAAADPNIAAAAPAAVRNAAAAAAAAAAPPAQQAAAAKAAAPPAAGVAAAANAPAAARPAAKPQPEPDCPICLEPISSGSSISLSCRHQLHADCLVPFLKSDEALDKDTNQYSCPSCKAAKQQPGGMQHAGQRRRQQQAGVVTEQHIRQLVQLGALTAEEEEAITRQQIRRAVGADYSCITCSMLLEVEPGPADAPSAYTVTCGSCNTKQCCSCGVQWGAAHKDLTCAQYKAQQAGEVDPETQKLLALAVPCPGGCNQGLLKQGEDSCNVLRCTRCRCYVCFLCGDKLDSKEFSLTDRHHTAANAHYQQPGMCCFDALWLPKQEWLEQQQRLRGQAAAEQLAAQQEQQRLLQINRKLHEQHRLQQLAAQQAAEQRAEEQRQKEQEQQRQQQLAAQQEQQRLQQLAAQQEQQRLQQLVAQQQQRHLEQVVQQQQAQRRQQLAAEEERQQRLAREQEWQRQLAAQKEQDRQHRMAHQQEQEHQQLQERETKRKAAQQQEQQRQQDQERERQQAAQQEQQRQKQQQQQAKKEQNQPEQRQKQQQQQHQVAEPPVQGLPGQQQVGPRNLLLAQHMDGQVLDFQPGPPSPIVVSSDGEDSTLPIMDDTIAGDDSVEPGEEVEQPVQQQGQHHRHQQERERAHQQAAQPEQQRQKQQQQQVKEDQNQALPKPEQDQKQQQQQDCGQQPNQRKQQRKQRWDVGPAEKENQLQGRVGQKDDRPKALPTQTNTYEQQQQQQRQQAVPGFGQPYHPNQQAPFVLPLLSPAVLPPVVPPGPWNYQQHQQYAQSIGSQQCNCGHCLHARLTQRGRWPVQG